MAVFPMFIDLKNKKCVVVGGGSVAERKIETLLGFNARIVVVSPQISDKIQELKWADRVMVIKKKYSEGDLEGAFMAVAATSDRRVNEKVHNEAVKSSIFVNVADNPELCTFIFPSVIQRDELVIGISTSGGFPALSKKVRKDVERVVPDELGKLLEILKKYRSKAEEEIKDAGKRKELLNTLLDQAMLFSGCVTDAQLEKRLNKIFEEYGNEKND